MRWSSDDVWADADGPAAYQVDLVGVNGAADWLF